jgi:hypothetical protein
MSQLSLFKQQTEDMERSNQVLRGKLAEAEARREGDAKRMHAEKDRAVATVQMKANEAVGAAECSVAELKGESQRLEQAARMHQQKRATAKSETQKLVLALEAEDVVMREIQGLLESVLIPQASSAGRSMRSLVQHSRAAYDAAVSAGIAAAEPSYDTPSSGSRGRVGADNVQSACDTSDDTSDGTNVELTSDGEVRRFICERMPNSSKKDRLIFRRLVDLECGVEALLVQLQRLTERSDLLGDALEEHANGVRGCSTDKLGNPVSLPS